MVLQGQAYGAHHHNHGPHLAQLGGWREGRGVCYYHTQCVRRRAVASPHMSEELGAAGEWVERQECRGAGAPVDKGDGR